MAKLPDQKIATLYRMVTKASLCPHGLKSKDLLERKGYYVNDVHLKSRAEADTFKLKQNVDTTPQTFIDKTRIGGFEELTLYFGKIPKSLDTTTYKPIIAIFSIAALLAFAFTLASIGSVFTGQTIEWFISISMVLLGLQKLQDLEQFSMMFLSYDLLAQRWPRYGYIYPFIETGSGLLMLAGIFTWLSAPLTLFVASIGAFSVFKAVYIDKRTLKCACVGGDSKVPLGFVSFTENIMMVSIAIWMLSKL